MRTAVAVILTSIVWLGVNQALAHLVAEPVPGGSYTEGLVGEPRFVNPSFAATSTVDADLTRLVFSGLLRYDERLGIVPDLAERYTTSDDGRTYTVTLREGLTWHDGEPLTADDVTFTFASLADPAVGSPLRPSVRGVAVEKLDERTARFALEDPYAGFPNLLTTGLIPRHVWGDVPAAEWRQRDENLQPVGSGPWQFNSLSRGANGSVAAYVLTRAVSPDRAERPQPFLERLIFRFYPDEEQAIAALRAQNIEGLALLGGGAEEALGRSKHLHLYDLRLRGATAVFFNLTLSSPVSDRAVRQALRSAIDKRLLVLEILPRQATVIHGPFAASLLGADADIPTAVYRPDEADALLAKAGWQSIGAIRQNKKGETLGLTLTVLDREPDRSVGGFIQRAWRAVGVETKIDLISPATAAHVQQTVLRPRAYEALLYTTAYGATIDPYPFWHSSQRVDPGLNLSAFSSEQADQAIELGRRALTTAAQQRAYAELQRRIFDEAPAIFLFAPIRRYAVSDRLRGVLVDEIGAPADRFNSLSRWYVKTKTRFRW
jgi:peptide/nickel transport system substrate-binding protein